MTASSRLKAGWPKHQVNCDALFHETATASALIAQPKALSSVIDLAMGWRTRITMSRTLLSASSFLVAEIRITAEVECG